MPRTYQNLNRGTRSSSVPVPDVEVMNEAPEQDVLGVEGLPESYQSLVAANPYLNYNYTRGLWDRIGNVFGFRTAEDKFREQMQLASREYNQQLLSMYREEQYNSPLAQVERQREAGINPDLNGVESSMASEFIEPEMSPEPPDGSDGLQFMGNVFSALTTAMGLAQGFTNLKGSMIENDLKDAQFVSQLFNFGRETFLNQLSPDDVRRNDHLVDENGNLTVDVTAMGIDPSFFHSKRSARRFFQAMNRAGKSVVGQAEAYSKLKEMYGDRKEIARFHGSGLFSDNDDDLDEVFGMLDDYAYENLKAQLKLDNKRTRSEDLDLDYDIRRSSWDLANGVPELEGEANKEVLVNTRENAKVGNEVAKSSRDLVHKLHQSSEEGNRWSSIMLFLLGMSGPLSSAFSRFL